MRTHTVQFGFPLVFVAFGLRQRYRQLILGKMQTEHPPSYVKNKIPLVSTRLYSRWLSRLGPGDFP
jgi:hypothetical protein